MPKKIGIILINYHDYGEKYLPACLESLRKQDYRDWTLFIVDNESTPQTSAYLRKVAPEAELIIHEKNSGFAEGNNAALKLMIQREFDYAWVLNMDTRVTPDALIELMSVLEGDKKIGAVQSRLMLFPEEEKVNSLGNTAHFLGFGYCLGYQDKYEARTEKIQNIFYPSGASVLFNLEALKEVGLFDEEFWMYNEDQDLGWRLWLRNYRCVINYQSVVFHQYEFSRSISKYYWMDRNRTLAIIKNYAWPTLVLVFPAWFFMELGLLLFSFQSGWLKERIRVILYFLKPRTWRYLIRARREIQEKRSVKDREILKMMSGKIWYQEVADFKLKLINPVFNSYFLLIKLFSKIFNF